MTDLETTFAEARADGAQVLHYEAKDGTEPTEAERVTVLAVTCGERTIVASVGWSGLGPFVDVFGFDAGERVKLDMLALDTAVMIRHQD